MKALHFLLACTGPIFWVCAAATSLAAPSPALVTKIVWQYALTSANDFSQRDPQDWRLLGSNDEGTNWTILDVRKGELFLERHQRRLFKLSHQAVFNLYRLEIDQVRDPTSANSVHLAEIEPLGASEDDLDPIPSFEDRITAQGENAPLESGFQAFDGQVETKWLDFASQNPATRSSWIQWQYLRRVGVVVTNVQQLLMLRARATEGYPVKIDGVLVNRLPGTNVMCFLDATGYLEVPCDADDLRFSPGQRVRLEGASAWHNKQVEIAHCVFTRGLPGAAFPRPIAIEEPLAPDVELRWVETEGTVRFCSQPEHHLIFELQDQDHTLSAQVLHLEAGSKPPPLGSRVHVRGICGGNLNPRGESVVGTLWVPSLADISLVATNALGGTSHPPELANALLRPGPVLTSIQQVRQLTPAELARRPRVEVHGVTTEVFGAYLQDETAGIELWLGGSPKPPTLPGLGSYVEVIGTGDWIEAHGPVIQVEKVTSLGKGKLPQPGHPSWAQLTGGRAVDQWVEIEGVVHSTDGSHLLLVGEGGPIMATVRSAPVSQVHALVDATVRLRGLNIMATDDRGQMQGIQMVVPSLEYVEVKRAPEDAFALPARPIASLFQVSGPKEFTHRVKIEGVLTFRENRKFFLQDASGGAMAIGREEVVLDSPPGAYHWAFYQTPEPKRSSSPGWEFKAGDRVQVVGFPESRAGYSPVLTEVLVRKVAPTASVLPVEAGVNDIVLGKFDSTLVSLEAVLLGREDLGEHHVFQLQAGQRVFQAVMPAAHPTPPSAEPGSRVRVTGVCQVEPSPYPELGKRINSFKLLVESPRGLAILERPPWWNLRRALAMAVALIVVLAIAAAWIGILHRQVEVRTTQLKKEIEERKRMEAEVELGHTNLLRTSRMAGMAEVATNVLHNVGNVLNGTNMLATLIVDQVRQSKVASLVKAVALLHDHRQDLGHFLTEDERGRHLPLLLEQLAGHLAEERNRLAQKVDALNKSVQHIKEVVTMQQRYAKISTLTETVSLTEVVEDALRLSVGALTRHEIKLVRQFEISPTVTIDRHKVLQILFNLLENAKRACVESGRPDKQVTVQILSGPADRVRICVQDNGTGISAENLPRIFAQGFSTRQDGHGFGLHSSMLAAQDVGGSLTVQSDGPGRGSTFTLELPIPR